MERLGTPKFSLASFCPRKKNDKIPKDRKGSLDNSSNPTIFSGGKPVFKFGERGVQVFFVYFFGGMGGILGMEGSPNGETTVMFICFG